MPVQRFAPMTKEFATFDCDAHVTEPPLIWERAHEFLTRDELDALKRTIWWDADGRLLIVNGRAGIGLGSPRKGGIPGTMRVISNAGPGVKHDIQRALNVRNLNPKTALDQEQVGYLDHAGSYEPKPRLREMDVQGIDQVMIIPTDNEAEVVRQMTFYKTQEEFLFASADAMREEYKAIIDAGLILQLDDPALATDWDMINPEPTVEMRLQAPFRRRASSADCCGCAPNA